MIDDALIQGVQKIANCILKKNYPLIGENHFNECDVRIILESLVLLLEEYDIQRRTKSNNHESKSRRGKSICKVSKE